jgi:HKD family nuclease
MQRYHRFRWSVAWASSSFTSCHFDLFAELLKRRERVEQLIVGTHFYQTHPDFLEAFIDDPKARFVLCPDGVFHPKIYLFENSPSDWACFIGSPNFTDAAFSKNVETVFHIEHNNTEGTTSTHLYVAFDKLLNDHWVRGKPVTASQLDHYRSVWKRKQHLRNLLEGNYGGNGSKPISAVKILGADWPEYVKRVKNGDKGAPLQERIQLLRRVRQLFEIKEHLSNLSKDDRQRVAGIVGERDGVDWKWFGSMVARGWFKNAINEAPDLLSESLDQIPSKGLVGFDDYERFVNVFKRAKSDSLELACATRLLSMKRPDTFVCLDGRNKAELCREFGITQNAIRDYEGYWLEIVERVRDSAWWNASTPGGNVEKEIWLGRTAFLDSLYYRPVAK